MIILASVLAALGVIVFLQGFVLMEMLRQVKQLRERLDLDDRPMLIHSTLLGKDAPVVEGLITSDQSSRLALVFLTTDCSTCHLVANGLTDLITSTADYLTVNPIVQAGTADEIDDFLSLKYPALDPHAIRDNDGRLARAFSITTRPAVVIVERGLVTRVAGVRNLSQTRRLIEEVIESIEEMPHDESSDIGARWLPRPEVRA